MLKRDRFIPAPGAGPELHGFGLQIWLQASCCGEVLWAYNAEHLDYLERYVGAKLRERQRDERWGWNNGSLESRLPRWMLSAKNRKEVLRGLATLRRLVAEGA